MKFFNLKQELPSSVVFRFTIHADFQRLAPIPLPLFRGISGEFQ
jgi:hypothetical protein